MKRTWDWFDWIAATKKNGNSSGHRAACRLGHFRWIGFLRPHAMQSMRIRIELETVVLGARMSSKGRI